MFGEGLTWEETVPAQVGAMMGIQSANLAVHGLEGKIAEAITYYQDEHNLAPSEPMAAGQCDFVMANPPFNVDLVDAERIKGKSSSDIVLILGLEGRAEMIHRDDLVVGRV